MGLQIAYSNSYSDNDLLDILRKFYIENNRPPYMRDFKGKVPSDSIIAKRFGTWLNALKLAGIKKEKQKESDYTEEYLLECLHDYYNKYGEVPSYRKFRSKGYPEVHSYIIRFGSYKNALIKAELFDKRKDKYQFDRIEYSKDELYLFLIRFIDENGKIPTHTEVNECLYMPSYNAYYNKFGGVYNALEEYRFDFNHYYENKRDDFQSQMIENFIKISKIIGRTPTSRDLDKYSKQGLCNGSRTYVVYFGSMHEIQRICNLPLVRAGLGKSIDELITDLKKLGEELDRTPAQSDIHSLEGYASVAKYADVFGSWSNALKAARFKPNQRIYYSTLKQTPCYSLLEFKFCNMLEKFSIDYKKEIRYSDYMHTTKKYRFDYIIQGNNVEIFIEIFGMVNNRQYEEKAKEKIELCNNNGLLLIDLYPADFYTNSLSKIYNKLQIKIEEALNGKAHISQTDNQPRTN